MDSINYFVILSAALVAIAGPGPATLAIAGTSLRQGRLYGLSLASGVLTGSVFWSIAAAFGLSAIMASNAWLFELFKYVGAGYLLFLAFKSARSAMRSSTLELGGDQKRSLSSTYLTGLFIHLTNPKAILFFGALYSIGVPVGTHAIDLMGVIALLAITSTVVFLGYALLFSNSVAANFYIRGRRGFEFVISVFFGFAALRILSSDLAR